MPLESTAPKLGIVHPTIDLLCVGLMSIVAISFAFVIGLESSQQVSLGFLITGATLINGAHFMASYRLLYFSKEQILRYKSAAIYIPAVLGGYCVWSLYRIVVSPEETYWVQTLLIVSSLYLALHYTGQAWGMMASFSFVEKTFFQPLERRIFWWCLKLLVFWQVIWSIYLIYDLPPSLVELRQPLSVASNILAGLALTAGTLAFVNMGIRIKRSPPLRVMIPFYTLFFWYSLLAVNPAALMGVQISHAIQYLIFPVRVEMNRHSRQHSEAKPEVLKHLGYYAGTLIFAALLFFILVPWALEDGFSTYSLVFITAINIHHFYIDGCIWKITSPVVKEDLFSHLPR